MTEYDNQHLGKLFNEAKERGNAEIEAKNSEFALKLKKCLFEYAQPNGVFEKHIKAGYDSVEVCSEIFDPLIYQESGNRTKLYKRYEKTLEEICSLNGMKCSFVDNLDRNIRDGLNNWNGSFHQNHFQSPFHVSVNLR